MHLKNHFILRFFEITLGIYWYGKIISLPQVWFLDTTESLLTLLEKWEDAGGSWLPDNANVHINLALQKISFFIHLQKLQNEINFFGGLKTTFRLKKLKYQWNRVSHLFWQSSISVPGVSSQKPVDHQWLPPWLLLDRPSTDTAATVMNSIW